MDKRNISHLVAFADNLSLGVGVESAGALFIPGVRKFIIIQASVLRITISTSTEICLQEMQFATEAFLKKQAEQRQAMIDAGKSTAFRLKQLGISFGGSGSSDESEPWLNDEDSSEDERQRKLEVERIEKKKAAERARKRREDDVSKDKGKGKKKKGTKGKKKGKSTGKPKPEKEDEVIENEKEEQPGADNSESKPVPGKLPEKQFKEDGGDVKIAESL